MFWPDNFLPIYECIPGNFGNEPNQALSRTFDLWLKKARLAAGKPRKTRYCALLDNYQNSARL